MPDFRWSRDLVIDALRARLLGDGAVTEGFTGVGVRPVKPGEPVEPGAADDHVVVELRWRRDPCLYAILVALEPGSGRNVSPLAEWVDEIVLELMEDLDTGMVRRATRTVVGDVTFLDDSGVGAASSLPGHDLGEVYLGPRGDYGGHLAAAGLDVCEPRRLLTGDRLACWLYAAVDDLRHSPVGHVAVAITDPDGSDGCGGHEVYADLAVLEVVPATAAPVTAELVYLAVRSAVEAGFTALTSTLDDPALDEVGFREDPGGGRSVTWRDVRMPEHRRRSARPSPG